MGGKAEGLELVQYGEATVLGQPSSILQCIQGGYREDGPRLFRVAHGRRMRGKRLQLKQAGQTGYEENLFPCEDSQAEKEADPGKALLSSALEIFST